MHYLYTLIFNLTSSTPDDDASVGFWGIRERTTLSIPFVRCCCKASKSAGCWELRSHFRPPMRSSLEARVVSEFLYARKPDSICAAYQRWTHREWLMEGNTVCKQPASEQIDGLGLNRTGDWTGLNLGLRLCRMPVLGPVHHHASPARGP